MERAPRQDQGPAHRVVVVGGGFGGLFAVRALRHARVEVTLVDRHNFHLFQPLAYQVATGALSAAEIAAPLRAVLKGQRNVRVVLAEVTGFDLVRQEVMLTRLANGRGHGTLAYDTLIVAGGSRYSYFGHDEWHRFAPGTQVRLRGRSRSAAASSAPSRRPRSRTIRS